MVTTDKNYCPECEAYLPIDRHKPMCSLALHVLVGTGPTPQFIYGPFSFADYHALISPTVLPSYPDFGDDLRYPALGCAEEAGELVGKIKKLWRDHKTTHASKIDLDDPEARKLWTGAIKEVGDMLWYLDAMATTLGTTLEACAQANVEKLTGRAARGTTAGSGDDR